MFVLGRVGPRDGQSSFCHLFHTLPRACRQIAHCFPFTCTHRLMAAQDMFTWRELLALLTAWMAFNLFNKYAMMMNDKEHSGIYRYTVSIFFLFFFFSIPIKSLQNLQLLRTVRETNVMLNAVSRAAQAQAQLNLQSCGCLRSSLCSPGASPRWRHRTRIKETHRQNTQAYWCCKPDGYSSGSLGKASGCWPWAGCKQELISWPVSAW